MARAGSTDALLPTLEDTVGPYYPRLFLEPDRHDLMQPYDGLTPRPSGTPMLLTGRVVDVERQPVAPVLLEFWQANARGQLRSPHNGADATLDPAFDGYARLYCRLGEFDLRTIKPGPVQPVRPEDGLRAPHVTVTIFCDGLSRVVTQVFFEDEPLNSQDPLLLSLPAELRARLIAKRDGEEGGFARYRLDIQLRGEQETPFFDDLIS